MARDIASQMILAEWLFVETVADVGQRSQNPGERSRYELLGIAPLLRMLLLDGASLVDTVRAGRPEVLLEFRVQPWRAPATDDETGPPPYALRLGGPESAKGPRREAPITALPGELVKWYRRRIRSWANATEGLPSRSSRRSARPSGKPPGSLYR